MTNSSSTPHVANFYQRSKLQLLCFCLEKEGDLYGINVFKVREIIDYKDKITKVSYENNSLIEGLISVRGVNIPLLDMRKWFYYNSHYPDKDLTPYATHSKESETIVMVCEFSKWAVGIKIYQADRILNKTWEEIEQELDFSQDLRNAKFISRTKYFDHRLVQIVDVEKMLTDIFPWINQENQKELSTFSPVRSKKVILFADDSPTVLHVVQNILKHLELKYYSFYNGKTLLDFIEQKVIPLDEIGLIITDIEMPKTSGFDVIKKIKENPLLSHIPIVVNSCMNGSSNEEIARSLQANDFISKSNPKEIERIIKYYLETT